MTFRRYLIDISLRGKSSIASIGNDDGGSYVCLDETLFHVQGGGQPADRGLIEGRPLMRITTGENDEVFHYLEFVEGLEIGQQVAMEIDEEWRRKCARLHSAGHLIASVVENALPELTAVSGHHFPGEARVEFISRNKELTAPSDSLAKLNNLLANTIADDLAVKVVFDEVGLRQIQIGSFNPTPCGGIHVGKLMELGWVEITKAKLKNGKLRLSYSTN